VTVTAGGGGAPWAAATLQVAPILSAHIAAFEAKELRAGIEVLLAARLPPRILLSAQMVATVGLRPKAQYCDTPMP
jgi:hypothetical protein